MATDNTVEKTIKKAIDELWREALKALLVRKNTVHFKQLQEEETTNMLFPNMLRNLQRNMLTSDVYFKLHELAQLGELSYELVQSFRDQVYKADETGIDNEFMTSHLLDLQFYMLSKESPIGQLIDITSGKNDDMTKKDDTEQHKKDPEEQDDMKNKTATSADPKQQLVAEALGRMNALEESMKKARDDRPRILQKAAEVEKRWLPRQDMTNALGADLFMTKAKLLVSTRKTTKLVTRLVQQAKSKERTRDIGVNRESESTGPKRDVMQVKGEEDDKERVTSDDNGQTAEVQGIVNDGNTSTDEVQQNEVENISLRNFIEFVAKKIRVNYADAAVEEQRKYVESFVHDVIKTLHELYPGLFDVQMVKSGSFYKGLKIMAPDEFDFLLLWALSVGTHKIIDTKDTRDLHKTKSGQVTLTDSAMVEKFKKMQAELGEELSEELPVIDPKTGSLSIYIYVVFQKAVMKCLEYLSGEDDFKKFSVDTTGPSVTVTLLQAPVCPTEVDLCLCVHHSQGEDGRMILVPVDPIRRDDCPNCDFGDTAFHWTMSICEKPTNKQGLDDAHRQIVFALKYVMTEMFSPKTDTYMLTTAVKRHFEKCHNDLAVTPSNIGKCFREIVAHVQAIYNTKYAWDNDDAVKDDRGIKLADVDFPMVDTAGRIDMAGRKNMLKLKLLTESVASHPNWREDWIPWVKDTRERFASHNVPDSGALMKMLNCLQPYKPDGW